MSYEDLTILFIFAINFLTESRGGMILVDLPPFLTLPYLTLRYVTLRYVTLRYVTLRYVTDKFITDKFKVYIGVKISKMSFTLVEL